MAVLGQMGLLGAGVDGHCFAGDRLPIKASIQFGVSIVLRHARQNIKYETQHIAYSAYCIGDYATWGNKEWLRDRVIYRQSTVNLMFLEEVDGNPGVGEMSGSMLLPKITTEKGIVA